MKNKITVKYVLQSPSLRKQLAIHGLDFSDLKKVI